MSTPRRAPDRQRFHDVHTGDASAPFGSGAALREAACASRRERQRVAQARARRQRRAAIAALIAVTLFVVGWRTIGAGDAPAPDEAPASTGPSLLQAGASDEPQGPATPLFATYRSLELHLPVAEADLTELAFHQASGMKALPMESLLPDADPSAVDEKHGTGRAPAEVDEDATEPRVLGGQVIRMWRTNHYGAPDTAADVGALAGTTVIAPVSGTVVQVKPYQLYGAHEDLEIHIQPTGWPEIDLVMIHVTDPLVEAGDPVIAGVTRVASVRLLSDRVDHQLAVYTPDAGDHVHLQLNRVEEPGTTEPTNGS